ncbi:MAG: outer membrane protein assembly factor BamC [Gammaproteobacteria bacterium]|nr:outer membrane protein assembly factor BamC [Gammaproteobacteria bacterium]
MIQVLLLAICAMFMVSGCSKLIPKLDQVLPDNRIEYRKSKSLPDLEVPPDLTTDSIKDRMAIPEGGDTATYSTYQERVAERKRGEELERTANEAVRVLDNEHVLAVNGAIPQIWPQLVKLMTEDLGYELELNDEELGILETVWIENQEELHREKFKLFAEPGEEAGTTVLYVSNRSEELISKSGNMEWKPTARDIDREKVLVERVQEALGGGEASEPVAANSSADETQTSTADSEEVASGGRAELISAGGGKVYLSVLEDFSAAWRSTGVALQKAGYDIAQSDKERGIYYIRVPASEGEVTKRGVLSKLKFWGDDDEHELQLNLTGVGDKTEVVVLDKKGRWETGDISKTILDRLHRELNRLDS